MNFLCDYFRKIPDDLLMIAVCVIFLFNLAGHSANKDDSAEKNGTKEPEVIETEKVEEQADESNSVTEEKVEVEVKADVDNSLNEQEYWALVGPKLETLLNENGFVIFRADTREPYCNLHVEYGFATEDGKYRASGLDQSEYEEKINSVKAQVHELLNMYTLHIEDGLFAGPDRDILGLHFHNRFVKEYVTHSEVERHDIADYQIDLSKYYTGRQDFVRLDDMSWKDMPVYKP